MADDVVLNKASIVERCLQRIEEEYEGDPAHLHQDITRQDSIILNLQRACQAAIDQVGAPTSDAPRSRTRPRRAAGEPRGVCFAGRSRTSRS